jgi:prophage antirepressor-like protein
MQLALQIFEHEYEHSNKIQTVDIDGEIWFVASGVCASLDLANVGQALAGLDEDEKRLQKLEFGKQQRQLWLVSEPGLYALIFKSRKPEAKQFKRWITHEVIPSIRKFGGYASSSVPVFVRRYNDNWDRVTPGFFSVISELFIRLYGRFEQIGYRLPDFGPTGKEVRPDVSVGRLFATWLAENHPDKVANHQYYQHIFPNGLEVPVREYPNEMLVLFIEFVESNWLKKHAQRYLSERDPKALPYLSKLLPAPRKNLH